MPDRVTDTVFHFIPSFAGGGAERQLILLCKALVAAGAEVHLAHLHGGPNMAAAQSCGATLHRIEVDHHYDPLVLGKLRSLFRRTGAQVVHTWLLHADVTGGLAARWAGVPWLMSERASATYYAGSLKSKLRELLGRGADAVVANSEAGAQYWRDLKYRGPLHVVRNIVPASAPRKGSAGEVLRDPQLIVAVGRLSPEKNYTVLLTALELLFARNPDVRIDILGEGPLRPALQQRIDSIPSLIRRVRLVGHVDDIQTRLERAAAFVSMSRSEGTPNAVLDAIRSGCPLVLSDIPAHREVADEQNAKFVPVDSPFHCAAALAECLLNPGASQARAERARLALSLQDWSAESTASAYLSIYSALRRAGN